MLNTNNIVNYKINIKQKEKKYSLSTVLAWLYLKTIGRILPKRWSKWAENILYYNKVIADQTDALKAVDQSIQVPEVVAQEIQSEIMSEDETTFQYMATQTDGLITVDESVQVPEVTKEESEDEGVYFKVSGESTDEDCSDIEVDEEEEVDNQNELLWDNGPQTISINDSVSEETEQLRSQLESDYVELKSVTNQIEKLHEEQIKENLVEMEKKDEKISSLTQLNKALEQDKKAMNDKNKTLQTEVIELKSKLKSKISNLSREKETLQSNVNILTVQLQSAQQQLEREKIDLEDKLKDSSSKLSAAEKENKRLENEVTKLQEQVRTLEESKEWESAGIDDSLKETSFDLTEMLKEELAKQEKQIEQLQKERKQAEDQSKIDIKKLQEEKEGLLVKIDKLRKKLESSHSVALSSIQAHSETLGENYELKIQKIENSTAGGEQQNGKLTEDTQEQTKAKELDTMSRVSIAKSTTKSTLSKLSNKLLKNENLDAFLSDQNKELKKSFPEFEKKHFCHNVLNEIIKSLSNQDDGKFESSKLLELLESNLKQSAREIIETQVKKVVNEHCKIGKNIGKELLDGMLKDKLLPSINECMKKLRWDEKGAAAITDSVLQDFRGRNNSSNDLVREVTVKELTQGRMNCFSNKIQGLQLALSIRDKFLSPDQKMCSKIPGEKNEYQLTEKAKKPSSSMSHTNSTLLSMKQAATSK
ncbi:hypothetical protein wVul_0085 [Wolbachia endosymbiont of Armadillidium vulgare str. wVulC]|uniref:hypothetical protein n=1 Tax=Wolbachia endosymbiont of Armadillidium vulgare TaxID=77039 RepID=UPI00064B055E|nr:hypothetical protein [Wolbachia endosymbiont of Armadillidium vulgare]KLT22882.1 hypothetical protein wVul_0085 [Wolbachia endosymbiont of Armadillidium vulgare str. wVulC]OJH31644.1 hypothetical protein Wxf_01038 [Wolbachia endosymbiont of Armadillidium vulgare]OJH32053.1 hypothetical protein Wxf_01472 [Wolbachia endosymbiont of Armadillidium vulgare]OJH32610.1 hypothetical protein Wxf_02052 [Wolbachia endosymbiont of Armadillidium vulgare]OJH33232.1 hypothetical protein Wxf_02706 [Wolbach